MYSKPLIEKQKHTGIDMLKGFVPEDEEEMRWLWR
jgi:hypothetical protein